MQQHRAHRHTAETKPVCPTRGIGWGKDSSGESKRAGERIQGDKMRQHIFPGGRDAVARDSAKALWGLELLRVERDIAYMEDTPETHILTYNGYIEKSILITAAQEDKTAIEAEIAKL